MSNNINQVASDISKEKQADLFEIFNVLWKSKVVIFIVVGVIGCAGGIYALLAQPWWTSNTIITIGRYQNIESLNNKIINYSSILKNESNDITNVSRLSFDANDIKKLNTILDQSKIFESFLIEFDSFNNKYNFLKNNALINSGMKNSDVEFDDEKFLNSWISKIKLVKLNNETNNIYQLSFQAKSKKDSYVLLSEYIIYINKIITKNIVNALVANIDYSKNILKINLKQLELDTQYKQEHDINFTRYSLEIAKAADANSPIPLLNDNSMFSIELGSKGLSEKERILENIKDLGIFDPEIKQMENKINILNQINLDNVKLITPFHYLKNISYPYGKDKPKRMLIILFSILAGFILGCVFVLGNALRKNEI